MEQSFSKINLWEMTSPINDFSPKPKADERPGRSSSKYWPSTLEKTATFFKGRHLDDEWENSFLSIIFKVRDKKTSLMFNREVPQYFVSHNVQLYYFRYLQWGKDLLIIRSTSVSWYYQISGLGFVSPENHECSLKIWTFSLSYRKFQTGIDFNVVQYYKLLLCITLLDRTATDRN